MHVRGTARGDRRSRLAGDVPRRAAVVIAVAAGALGSAAAAQPDLPTETSVQSAARAAATAGPALEGPGDQRLQQCQQARTVCDPAAAAVEAARDPVKQPPSPGATYLTRSQAEQRARNAALGEPGTAVAPTTAAVYSALMTRPAFEAATNEGHNAAVDPGRLVWVVTVHAPTLTEGSPSTPPESRPVYSIAFDAESGQWTDECIGCAWLSTSS